jgi:hypothetical protein
MSYFFEWPEELEEHVWEFVHSDFKCKWKAKRWNDIHKHLELECSPLHKFIRTRTLGRSHHCNIVWFLDQFFIFLKSELKFPEYEAIDIILDEKRWSHVFEHHQLSYSMEPYFMFDSRALVGYRRVLRGIK